MEKKHFYVNNSTVKYILVDIWLKYIIFEWKNACFKYT